METSACSRVRQTPRFWSPLQFQFQADFEAGTAGHATLRLVVDDPDALFREYADKGVFHDETQLRDTPWGTRKFAFWDLNHNGLTFMRDL